MKDDNDVLTYVPSFHAGLLTRTVIPTYAISIQDRMRSRFQRKFYGHGSQVNLDEKRFAYVDTYEPNGCVDSYKFFYDAATSYLDAQTTFNVDTEEYSAGFLSFMGLGVTETKKLTAKFTAHSSKEFHSSQKAEVSVHFYTQPDEIYSMAVYYDRVFGTFAFKDVVSNPSEWVSGVARASNGQPAAKQVVSLTVGGKKYSTRTDA